MNEWNDIAVIAPAHDIDIITVPLLREQVDGLVDGGVRRVLVNCQSVSFIDSTGLAFLLSCARRLSGLGGLLSLVNASPYVVRFLQIARLIDALHVTAANKPPIPVLSADESPLWSKTLSVSEGIENLPYYRHRVSDLLSSLPMTAEDRFDTALAAGEALSNAVSIMRADARAPYPSMHIATASLSRWVTAAADSSSAVMKRLRRARYAVAASSLCACWLIAWRSHGAAMDGAPWCVSSR